MTRLRQILILCLFLAVPACVLYAQPVEEGIRINPLTEEGFVEWDYEHDLAVGTNGVIVRYGNAVLTADSVAVDQNSGEVTADGRVRIRREDEIWAGEHVQYNFFTRRIEAGQFRTGQPPMFVSGEGLRFDTTNNVYVATNAILTADDVMQPGVKMHAKYLEIVPGRRIVARKATVYVQGVPVFYFPYFSHSLGRQSNHFSFVPGYRSSFGPYFLGSYSWFLSPDLDGQLHLDYRERRGVGAGPDFNYHFGPWGQGTLRYYYLYDQNPEVFVPGAPTPNNRERVYFTYQANPIPTVAIKSVVRYQGDTNIVREFFESEFRQNPQPNTFFEVNKFWNNFSLDSYAQPRLNNYLETVERLPDVRLTGYRQELGGSPFYYESESSLGYYRHLFAETNSDLPGTNDNYAAARGDSYHQIVMPETFFGWLNVTPRVGGRFTYYSESSGVDAKWDEETRGVFNTGAEASFKASRVWPDVRSDLLDVDGLRHILQPSVDYVFVPKPNVVPNQLPQFDSELPSLELLPLEFPEYNAIDQIDARNAVRLGLGNKLQTKRDGAVTDLLKWQLFTDWRLDQSLDHTNLTRFSDVYSDLAFKPRSWLTIDSKTRFDVADGVWRMSLTTLTLEPNNIWSWSVGHFYLHTDDLASQTGLGEGNALLMNTIYLRLNEDWGLRTSHYYDARTSRLEEQAYTIFRDLRSWTAALTFHVRENPVGPQDLSVTFTFSLKAFPHYDQNDIRMPYSLWGG
jgi:lipopolysaccharide assembly outer membrane protein LptD (OstA)